jgi:hypothetical protein
MCWNYSTLYDVSSDPCQPIKRPSKGVTPNQAAIYIEPNADTQILYVDEQSHTYLVMAGANAM